MPEESTEKREYKVRYLAEDGEIRYTTVEASSEEEAKSVAYDDSYSHGWCGDSINKIIDVS